MGKIRGTHSSPGIYTQINDFSYTAKNLGLTSLGLVGETLKGPAFEPIEITNWGEFENYFGGTSAEKFKDSQYPKYELPYIAQSYLKASDRLYVCRVLGLSGYNAGPAFFITASKDGSNPYVIAVLRARGRHIKYGQGDKCNTTDYDKLVFDCDDIAITEYRGARFHYDCTGVTTSSTSDNFSVSILNKGRFTIVAYKDGVQVGEYSVSLNPGAKDYLYNVIGSDPNEGSAAVFVEELYDVMLENLIDNGKVNRIDSHGTGASMYKAEYFIKNAIAKPVADFLTIPASEVSKKQVHVRYLYASEFSEGLKAADAKYLQVVPNETGVTYEETAMKEGGVYEVKSYTENNVKKYGYFAELTDEGAEVVLVSGGTEANVKNVVKILAYDAFVEANANGISFCSDFCDYREQFRYASTPWIVSELKGSLGKTEVKKLFRFHTITDGNAANSQIKISIANIRPEDGTFDVYVRDYYDTDDSPTILESFKNLDMVPGSNKYIGLKIGTLNGDYELKSKYVMVEVIENEMTENCVPAGFLGYPVRAYANNLKAPEFTYNLYYDDDVKEKKQYFGLSDITGVDVDMLTYKGKNAYTENYAKGYTNAFHLDSTLSTLDPNKVWVDDDINGIKWDCVDASNVTSENKAPIISTEADMEGTIYEDVRVRKFTVYPYGGFDGWDIYRRARTNTNEFKANKYKGTISNGEGATFSTISNGTVLALTGNCITSDYYAYLAGINQFENPEKYEINLFATPGIDYVNNELLVSDAFDMVENRLDTFYVPTTPDKPYGATDAEDEMFSSMEVADNLSDTVIDSYYGASYYPWVKYFDKKNNKYINLPATKDVLRNMANIDNKYYPWIAPAGLEKGNVECSRLHFHPKMEDRDNVYDNRINALMSYQKDGVKIWGNKTLYICDETNPMNRINNVRLLLYMRKIIVESTRGLVFGPNDATLREEWEGIIKPILSQIKSDRGVTDYRLQTSQTKEQMDLHEISAAIWVKPTPTAEYFEIAFNVTPQGVEFL